MASRVLALATDIVSLRVRAKALFVSFSAFSAVYDPVAIVAVTAPLVLPEMVFASATDTVPDTDTAKGTYTETERQCRMCVGL